MRIIKFRVWDIEGKLWVAGWHIPQSGVLFDNGQKIYSQFTNLIDKNGREIYEGDIVKGTKKDVVCEVTFNSHNGGYYAKHKDYAFGYVLMIPEGRFGGGKMICPFEVIGNIYENQDLLT